MTDPRRTPEAMDATLELGADFLCALDTVGKTDKDAARQEAMKVGRKFARALRDLGYLEINDDDIA